MTDITIVETQPTGAMTMASEMKYASTYYAWVMSQFISSIGENVLDIGGGFGTHLELILPRCKRLTTTEILKEDVKHLSEKFPSYPQFRVLQFELGCDSISELVSKDFDTVTCFNVLEHIEDDRHALKEIHALLVKQQGYLCLQVPAHQWLFGSLDQEAGHFRRYSASCLRELLNQTGFQIRQLHYFNFFGVVPWLLNARVFKRPIQAKSVNMQVRIFNRYIVPIVRQIEAMVKPPFGQSLIAVGQAILGRQIL